MLKTCLAAMVFAVSVAGGQDVGPEKRTALDTVDRHRDELVRSATRIWELAEIALKESESAALLAGILEKNGFAVRHGVSKMPTAFVAEWGRGKPVIAYLSEYDALPGLSQKVATRREVRVPGGGGHGCGHNLFGAASVGAALALKAAMERHDIPGTVRLYGTPAEEQGIGKVFMVRDGLFDDVDICLSWHPSSRNEVNLNPSKALRSFEVTFFGRSAHAAAAPWDGVSALDAVEAFGTGVNLLREHMPETARIHYVVTDGGAAPNVIPAKARIWAYVRGKDWREQQRVYEHVLAIVKGADLMAWGEEHGHAARGFRPAEVKVLTGLYDYNVNPVLARVVHDNFEKLGVADYTEAEHEFAKGLQRSFGFAPTGYSTIISPFDPDRKPRPGGSTDVANISWVTPTVDLNVATWPIQCPAHSWMSTSASGAPGGMRAMLQAARVLACSGVDLLRDGEARARIRTRFELSRKGFDYEPPVKPDDVPSLPVHMRK